MFIGFRGFSWSIWKRMMFEIVSDSKFNIAIIISFVMKFIENFTWNKISSALNLMCFRFQRTLGTVSTIDLAKILFITYQQHIYYIPKVTDFWVLVAGCGSVFVWALVHTTRVPWKLGGFKSGRHQFCKFKGPRLLLGCSIKYYLFMPVGM